MRMLIGVCGPGADFDLRLKVALFFCRTSV
jgi:hypothetical protein